MVIKSNISRYENIAYQIASKIYQGDIPIHSKLSGRTLLSSEYNVSSETIRRAIQSLVKYGIVKVKEQSGIYVISSDKAKIFLDDFEVKKAKKNQKLELLKLIEEERAIHTRMDKIIKTLMNTSELFPFDYFKIKVKQDSKVINQSIKALDFYKQTGGLIIAYELENVVYQVPSPDTVLKVDMILYIMGDLSIKKKVEQFI